MIELPRPRANDDDHGCHRKVLHRWAGFGVVIVGLLLLLIGFNIALHVASLWVLIVVLVMAGFGILVGFKLGL